MRTDTGYDMQMKLNELPLSKSPPAERIQSGASTLTQDFIVLLPFMIILRSCRLLSLLKVPTQNGFIYK